MTLFIIGVIVVFVIMVLFAISNQKQAEKLKADYDDALRGTDKRKALEAGRAYYSNIRKGKTLTIYDEQAITNDLSTMKTNDRV